MSHRYQRLKPGSEGPDVCPVHMLLKRDKVSARLDVEYMNRLVRKADGQPVSL